MLCDICAGVIQHRRGIFDRNGSERYRPRSPDFVEMEMPPWFSSAFSSPSSSSSNVWFDHSHHPTLSTFMDSVAKRCHICRSLWEKLSGEEQEFLRVSDIEVEDKDRGFTVMHIQSTKTLDFVVGVFFQHTLAGTANIYKEYGLELVQREAPDLFGEIELYSHTSSGEALQIAGQWLQNCLQNHKACNRRNQTKPDPTWYPTRLLYLGNTDRDVRLVVTAEEPPTGPYTTLSHRWGSAQFIKLRKSNLTSFCTGLPVTEMPKTFQEAISASRQLGVQYLWIDSICIMQDKDDLTDWVHEASMMSRVYSSSHCNLSASDTDEDTEGLFRSRDLEVFDRTTVQLCTAGFDTATEFIECEVVDPDIWDRNINKCPIQKRGWVFQERVLAPRVLHFGHDQLFWECREQRACERFPHGLPPIVGDWLGINFKEIIDLGKYGEDPTPQNMEANGPDEPESCYRLWKEVVNEYSQTTLTDRTDKLIAISGIARSFADITGDSYVAGMWRKNLEYALLWKCFDRPDEQIDHPDSSRPAKWCAPTWSWASVDSTILIFWDDNYRLLFTVQDVVVTHSTEDEMGLITGGWLDLRGALKPMTLSYGLDDPYHVREWFISELGVAAENFRMDNVSMFFDVETSNPSAFEHDNAQGNLFYMPVACAPRQPDTSSADLLVLRVVDWQKFLFERVGLAFVYGIELGNLDALIKSNMSEEEQKRLPSLQYHGDGTHTIRIV